MRPFTEKAPRNQKWMSDVPIQDVKSFIETPHAEKVQI